MVAHSFEMIQLVFVFVCNSKVLQLALDFLIQVQKYCELHKFFLQQRSVTSLLADACTWCGKELRTYMIVGAPGTGKTELTVWLAGYLRVPLYRISLNDPRLTDQVFAQLISPTTLKHDNALIQLDEFQETLKRWRSVYSSTSGVSDGGFWEVFARLGLAGTGLFRALGHA